jgi:dCMP deaminase
MTIGIAYIPVIHRGYLEFCESVVKAGGTTLYLIGDDILEAHIELDYLNRKDRIRAIPQSMVATTLAAATALSIDVLSLDTIRAISADTKIVMPREDVSRILAKAYFPNFDISYLSTFLRWNRDNVGAEKVPDTTRTVPADAFQASILSTLDDAATQSADWWRQVGAALVKDGALVAVAHNEHMPDEQLPNVFGDTRAMFKKGDHIEYVTSAHAEVGVLGEVARKGISSEGADLYVTDFPCPYCARLIAKSGVKTVYFRKGYAVLEGDRFLKMAGVEVVRIQE